MPAVKTAPGRMEATPRKSAWPLFLEQAGFEAKVHWLHPGAFRKPDRRAWLVTTVGSPW